MGLNVSAFTDFGFKMFLLSIVIMLLPESPFEHYITLFSDIPYLQYLNWFIPIGEIVAVFEVWLAVVVTYYGYMVVMRYVNGIKG